MKTKKLEKKIIVLCYEDKKGWPNFFGYLNQKSITYPTQVENSRQ